MTSVASLPDLSDLELKNRERRKSSYHLVASKNKLPEDPEEEEDPLYKYLLSTNEETTGRRRNRNHLRVQEVKRRLVLEIARSEGDSESPQFQSILDELLELHDPTQFDARLRPKKHKEGGGLEGMWINLTKPKFPDCLGKNSKGDLMYTLGRMSFERFSPAKLICSIQGTFNPVHVLKDPWKMLSEESVPNSLIGEIKSGKSVVRSYQIVTAFAVEPYDSSFGADSPNAGVDRPIEGLITTFGFVVANPKKPNRLSIWFTGGTMEIRSASEASDMRAWRRLFTPKPKPPSSSQPALTSVAHKDHHWSLRSIFAKRHRTPSKEEVPVENNIAATKKSGAASSSNNIVMEPDGKMSYRLRHPVGGHDVAYVDLLYMDETLRVVRAYTGLLHVMARVPFFPDE